MKLFYTILIISFLQISFAKAQSKREFRATWLSTVNNIDWPSRAGLTTDQQKAELIEFLDLYVKNGLNAVIFQIRPAADAFYKSEYEPWSKWLTGEVGKAPQPFYDPLEFIISEAHKRNLEIHAWLNPFRAWMDTSSLPTDKNHIINKQPDWFLNYGKIKYFDPGIPDVRNYITEIVKDVVKRYDIDAIHFDDYFYPYKIPNLEFPDTTSFKLYGKGYTVDNKADWRRANVDDVIEKLHLTIKKTNSKVKFGISPFGIWRNKKEDPRGSESNGMTNYDGLYADILKWLENEWIDYVVPQIYWNIGKSNADYATLSKWWAANSYGKHVYIGHGLYRKGDATADKEWLNPSEMPNQIRLNRSTANIQGSSFFTSKNLKANPLGFCDSLQQNFYAKPAIIPQMKWIDSIPPARPFIHTTKVRNEFVISWDNDVATDGDTAKYYAVYFFKGKQVGDIEDVKNLFSVTNKTNLLIVRKPWQLFRKRYTFVVTAFDKLHNESTTSNQVQIRLKF